MQQQLQTITGTLTKVRFHSDDTHYTVAAFRGEHEDFKAVGSIMNPQHGMDYTLHGKEEYDQRWGKQFKFQSYKQSIPQDKQGIYRYIVNNAKWVGPAVGHKLIDAYGDRTLEMLREFPEKVAAEINGITLKRAEEIQITILENEEMEDCIVALEAMIGGLGLRKTLPMEIAKEHGWNAVIKLRENPYLLTKFKGIGFLSADMVAIERIKIDPRSIHRQKAGIKYLIDENEGKGNTWIDIDELHRNAQILLQCDVSQGMKEVVKDNVIIEEKMMANVQTAADEETIANGIIWLLLSE